MVFVLAATGLSLFLLSTLWWIRLSHLCKTDGRDWQQEKQSCSGGQGLAQKSLNPIICWWLGLHSLPGSLSWGDPALRSMGSMVGLIVNSKRVYTVGDLPILLLLVPHPPGELLTTHTPTGGSPTLLGSFGSVSCGRFCCAIHDWSLCFPQSCGSPIIKSHWLQGQIP